MNDSGRTRVSITLVLLACLSLAPSVMAAPLSSAGPILAQLAAQAKNPSLPTAERLRAVEALRQWGTADVRAPLEDLLKDPTPEIRATAAKGLGWPGNAPAIPALADRLGDKTETSAVRVAATGAIAKIGDPASRPVLLRASRDPDPLVREQAFTGLLTPPLVSPADRFSIAKQTIEDNDVGMSLRAEAIRILTSTKDPAAVPVLVNVLENGPRLQVVAPPLNANDQEILQVRHLQIRDIRGWAARGLGELGDQSVLPNLIKATEDSDDFFVRYLAAGALVSWRAPQALPAFVRLADDPSADVRRVAVTGVGVVGNQSNVEILSTKLTTDATHQVRVAAAESLATIGGDAARQKLQAAFQQEVHPDVRHAIEKALERLKR